MLKKYKFTTVFFTQMYKKSTQEQLSQWLFVLMYCTSVSAVLIRSLNFYVLFMFSCNL